MKIKSVIFIFLSIFCFFNTAQSSTFEPKSADAKIGSVSAWGTTLDDVVNSIEHSSLKLGGTDYIITSARSGNRYYATADIYKKKDAIKSSIGYNQKK